MVLQNFQIGRITPHILKNGSHQREDFLACLSFFAHEARNPLALIEQSVLTLMESADTTPATIEAYKRILLKIEEIKRLLTDVGEFAPGNLELRNEPTELGPVILDSVELVRPMMEAKSQNILCVVDPMPIQVLGDSMRLTQVFSNLLANASKYSPSHSRIEIAAHHMGDSALIFVRDEGIGFEAKDRDQIFDMTFGAGNHEGSGELDVSLGLALVSRLVKLHHGSVEAKSEGIARGSEFTVRLPINRLPEA